MLVRYTMSIRKISFIVTALGILLFSVWYVHESYSREKAQSPYEIPIVLHAASHRGSAPLAGVFTATYPFSYTAPIPNAALTIDFGDGNRATRRPNHEILHIYKTSGVYTASLRGCNPRVDLACVYETFSPIAITVE
jgi:hypothetical protein